MKSTKVFPATLMVKVDLEMDVFLSGDLLLKVFRQDINM